MSRTKQSGRNNEKNKDKSDKKRLCPKHETMRKQRQKGLKKAMPKSKSTQRKWKSKSEGY
jgi:hypothetical protein